MTTEVTTREQQQPPTIGQVIQRMQPELARALPRGMDAERVARLALTVVRQSDMAARKEGKPQNSLANCTPESFAGSLLTACALGLEPGVDGEAWLVPYAGECTFIAGYKGLAKLFWQHPLAKHLDTQAVHEHDDFDYAYGTSPYLKHKPARGERGKITDYYAVATLSTGASAFVVLTAEEVRELRGGKVGPSGRIKDPQHWMERKTVLKQLIKLLPKSPLLAAALAVDEQPGSVLRAYGVPQAVQDGGAVGELPPTRNEQDREEQARNRVTADEVTGEVFEHGGEQLPVEEPDYPPGFE